MMHEPTPSTRVLIPMSEEFAKSEMVEGLLPLLKFHASNLVLFRVVRVPGDDAERDRETQNHIERARQEIETMGAWLREQGYRVETRVVASQDVPGAIIREAMVPGYTLVILIRRRRKKGILSWFSRSGMTNRIVSNVEIPVVSVTV